jgi:hypothetical protein
MYFDEVDMHALCSVSEGAEKAEKETEKEAEKDAEKVAQKEAEKEAAEKKAEKEGAKWEPEGLNPPPLLWPEAAEKKAEKEAAEKKAEKKAAEDEEKDEEKEEVTRGLLPPLLGEYWQGGFDPSWSAPPLTPHFIVRGGRRACGCDLPFGSLGACPFSGGDFSSGWI